MDKTRIESALQDYKLRVVKRVIEITRPDIGCNDTTIVDLDAPYDVVYQQLLDKNISHSIKRQKIVAKPVGRKRDNAVYSGSADSGSVSIISRFWRKIKRFFSKLRR